MSAFKYSVTPQEIKELSVLTPWRTTLALVMDWLVIAAAIAISEYMDSWLVYLLAVAFIAGRMHALGALLHDGAHYRFIKNRKASDWIMDLVVAWPVLATVDSYRRNHLAHHRHTNTEDDPDWVVKLGKAAFTFPKKAWQAIVQLGGYLVAINTFRDLAHVLPRINKFDKSTRSYKLARLGYYAAWAILFTLLGIWEGVLLYWIVPYFTVFYLFMYIRGVAEHFGGMDYDEELGGTRTVKPHFWERWFLAPHNINYHAEHHLCPGVPFYNLPKLHAALMRDDVYRSKVHLTRGYSTGLVKECLS